jgi:C-terminal processing protease CtpA/Prc
MLAAGAVVGCGGGGGPAAGNGTATGCSVAAQRQAVHDLMVEWYFFNDELEQQQKYTGLNLNTFPSAQDLLSFLRYRPQEFDRGFSFITTPAADAQFFGEGQFVGFGFGSKFVDAPVNADLRLTQVFSASPAAAAGFQRGQRIVAIDGRTIAEIGQAEGLSAALGAADVGVTRTFLIRDPDPGGAEFEVAVAKALVTIDPVPSTAIFDVGGTTVGYVDFRTFISTADAELDQAFAEFALQDVSALVVDLRYNGGGLVSTAERLANLIGGFIASDQVLSETLFNSSKSTFDSVVRFQDLPGSLSLLQEVVFITTGSSASASELVINALKPKTLVTLVGSTTFGKPVGQSGFPYCNDEFLLRPVTFETVNALGEGRYFDGIMVDCNAADDLGSEIGDPAEASLATALEFLETRMCPPTAFRSAFSAPAAQHQDIPLDAAAQAAQRLLGAY